MSKEVEEKSVTPKMHKKSHRKIGTLFREKLIRIAHKDN